MARRWVLSLRLKAQYVYLLAAVVVGALILFSVMYVSGLSSYLCVPLTLGLGGFGISRVYRMSKRYGQYGLMKWRARKGIPAALLSGTRKFFIHLFSDHATIK
jgi:hypothetical protein